MKPISLLLVDNQEDGLNILEKSLARSYQTVMMAFDKEEALSLFRQNSFDVVIVALEMDKNEGYETITAISNSNSQQRIITYSADPENPSSNVSCDVCTQNNRRHRIRKPIHLNELFEEIEKFDQLVCREARLKKSRI